MKLTKPYIYDAVKKLSLIIFMWAAHGIYTCVNEYISTPFEIAIITMQRQSAFSIKRNKCIYKTKSDTKVLPSQRAFRTKKKTLGVGTFHALFHNKQKEAEMKHLKGFKFKRPPPPLSFISFIKKNPKDISRCRGVLVPHANDFASRFFIMDRKKTPWPL